MAANSERQEVKLTVTRPAKHAGTGEPETEERVYTLKMTTEASIGLEDRLGKTTGEIMQSVGKFGVKASRDIIHALLQEHHSKEFPDTAAGLKAVNRLIDDAGGIVKMMALIATAVGTNKDDAKDTQLAGDGPNPQ